MTVRHTGHAPGTYLGGIRTLEGLFARCRIDHSSDCWHWSMAFVQGNPKVHFVTPDTGERLAMRGMRAAMYLRDGHDLPDGFVAWRTTFCKSPDCVNPGHARSGDRMKHGEHIRKTGALRGLPQTIASNRRIARSKLNVITIEQAREIRTSEERNCILAKQYGIAHSQISAIKRGEAWQEAISSSSVFDWRPS